LLHSINHELMRHKKKRIYFVCCNMTEPIVLHLIFLLMPVHREVMPQDDFSVRWMLRFLLFWKILILYYKKLQVWICISFLLHISLRVLCINVFSLPQKRQRWEATFTSSNKYIQILQTTTICLLFVRELYQSVDLCKVKFTVRKKKI